MDKITSRKNKIIAHMRALGSSRPYRRETGEYLCDGEKLLREALDWNAQITAVLWGSLTSVEVPSAIPQYLVPPDLINYVSPLKNTPGPVFSVKILDNNYPVHCCQALVLEGVQDPGNVGTVIRTANALETKVVILVGDCADPYNPKAVRAAMGALFRQPVLEMDREELKDFLQYNKLTLWGAALGPGSEDIRNIDLEKTAVAIGSEGRGLSSELLAICSGRLIIPMSPSSESLNAAVAASIVMWEMKRGR
ncbi:MAG TPA: RNA methyltransferase [Clostridiales bacterium]|nr:RNA methyltransferase [Clostridiales bacterium]